MPVPALAMLKPTSTPLLQSFSTQATGLPVGLPTLLAPTQCTQADSWVVVRSDTIGSSPPYGLWGLRPTFRVPTKRITVLLPVISVPPFSFWRRGVLTAKLRRGLRLSI